MFVRTQFSFKNFDRFQGSVAFCFNNQEEKFLGCCQLIHPSSHISCVFLNVYSTEYQQIGCFRIDSGPLIPSIENTDPILNGDYTERSSAKLKCLNAARRKGNRIFAFKNGGECLSSSDGHYDVITKYEAADNCKNDKGSADAMNIYIIKGELIYCLPD